MPEQGFQRCTGGCVEKMTKQETENLLDALEEWFDVVGPKELEKNETGLNSDRYEKLITKLKASSAIKKTQLNNRIKK